MASHILLNLALFLIPLSTTTRITNPFELTKWLVTGLILVVMMAIQLFSSATPKLPAIPRRGVALLVAVIVGQLIGIFIHNRLVWSDYLYYLFVLFGYGYFFYNDFQKSGFSVLQDYAKSLLIGSFLVAVIGVSQIWGFKPLQQIMGIMNGEGVAATFGNINYTGQYIGLCVLFFIFGNATSESKVFRRLHFAGIVLSLTYFSFLNTRSIIVGLTLAASWFVWRGHLLTKRRFAQLIVATSVAITLTHALGRVTKAASQPRAVVGASRQESANIRLDMWAGAAQMIADHPLGVGVMNFRFEFVPYREWAKVSIGENEIILSPHNEFLSIAAQSGLPVALLIFYACYWLFSRFARAKAFALERPGVYDLFVGLSLLFFVEALFQFPFDGEWSIVVFSMLVAGFASVVFGAKEATLVIMRPVALCIAIFGLYALVAWYRASATYSHEALRSACEARPQDWFRCKLLAEQLYLSGKFEEAESVLKAELERNPNNWLAMGVLGELYMNSDKELQGCEILRKIDVMFNQKSRAHDFIGTYCQGPR